MKHMQVVLIVVFVTLIMVEGCATNGAKIPVVKIVKTAAQCIIPPAALLIKTIKKEVEKCPEGLICFDKENAEKIQQKLDAVDYYLKIANKLCVQEDVKIDNAPKDAGINH